MADGYEWDEAKRRANLAKHGLDFADVEGCEWPTAEIVEDRSAAYGEAGWIAYGLIRSRVCALVFSERGHRTRVISLRYADRKEVIRYVEQQIEGQRQPSFG